MNKVPGIITDEVVTPKVETPMKNILLDIILCAGIIAIIILNGCLYSEVKNINDSISKINKSYWQNINGLPSTIKQRMGYDLKQQALNFKAQW